MHYSINTMYVCSQSLIVSDFDTPWTVAHKAPLSMKFSRQVYWSMLLFPTPGDLPDPGIKTVSLAVSPALAFRFFTTSVTTSLIKKKNLSKSTAMFFFKGGTVKVLFFLSMAF